MFRRIVFGLLIVAFLVAGVTGGYMWGYNSHKLPAWPKIPDGCYDIGPANSQGVHPLIPADCRPGDPNQIEIRTI